MRMKAFLIGMLLTAVFVASSPSASAGGRHCRDQAVLKIKVGRVRVELGGGDYYRQEDRYCSYCGCHYRGYHQCQQMPAGGQYSYQYNQYQSVTYNQSGPGSCAPGMYYNQEHGCYMYSGESYEMYLRRVGAYQTQAYPDPRYNQSGPQPVLVQPAAPVYSQQAPTGPSRYCDRCGGNHPSGYRCR
jgi:hypothetical protein